MAAWIDDPTVAVAHRPWPLPARPWLLAQRWTDLLFAHWPVATDVVRALVPRVLPLDLYEGRAWVSIAPFYISHLRARPVRAVPLPGLSAFPELNVRTYVVLDQKPGVYFFSLDAGSPLAVAGARLVYHLPYYRAAMRLRRVDGRVEYTSRRTHHRAPPARFRGRYAPTGAVERSAPGSLDFWLTERYCLYAVDPARRVFRADIHHVPWPLQPATAQIDRNTMAEAAGITLPRTAPRLSFARRLDVVVWSPEPVPTVRRGSAADPETGRDTEPDTEPDT